MSSPKRRAVYASTHGGNDRVRAEPFEQVELDPVRWWLDAPKT